MIDFVLENTKVFFDFNKADLPTNTLPDGMAIDKGGNLWVAMFNGSCVVVISTKSGKFCNN